MKYKANESIAWPGGKAEPGEDVDGSLIPSAILAKWVVERSYCAECGAIKEDGHLSDCSQPALTYVQPVLVPKE